MKEKRTLIRFLVLGLGLFCSRFATECQAQPHVTLAWEAETNLFVGGYYLAWGTNSSNYSFTNTYTTSQTSGTISNLTFGLPYYIAVASFAVSNSGELSSMSPYSSEITYITNAPAVVIVADAAASGPPMPPLPPGAVRPGASGAGNNVPGAATISTAFSATNIIQALIPGIPPVLTGFSSNSQNYLTIQGTVGATCIVQASPLGLPVWTTFTNVTMTTPMATNIVPGMPQNAIDLAFVPSVQTIALPSFGVPQMFQVLMPYDYAVLASMVLTNQGYTTRLISVTMPGNIVDDCCYVGQAGGFIHYGQLSSQLLPTSSLLQLEGSGPTIRQIATTLANALNMNWTSASEFAYSNFNANILATVVEADAAASDPVAGTNVINTIININF